MRKVDAVYLLEDIAESARDLAEAGKQQLFLFAEDMGFVLLYALESVFVVGEARIGYHVVQLRARESGEFGIDEGESRAELSGQRSGTGGERDVVGVRAVGVHAHVRVNVQLFDLAGQFVGKPEQRERHIRIGQFALEPLYLAQAVGGA